jgi:hypothetical protein
MLDITACPMVRAARVLQDRGMVYQVKAPSRIGRIAALFGAKVVDVLVGAARSVDEDVAFGGGWGIEVLPRRTGASPPAGALPRAPVAPTRKR